MKTETAATEDLVLGAGVVQETGGSPGGAGALASVELESADKSEATGIVKAETATEDQVLGAGVATELACGLKVAFKAQHVVLGRGSSKFWIAGLVHGSTRRLVGQWRDWPGPWGRLTATTTAGTAPRKRAR